MPRRSCFQSEWRSFASPRFMETQAPPVIQGNQYPRFPVPTPPTAHNQPPKRELERVHPTGMGLFRRAGYESSFRSKVSPRFSLPPESVR